MNSYVKKLRERGYKTKSQKEIRALILTLIKPVSWPDQMVFLDYVKKSWGRQNVLLFESFVHMSMFSEDEFLEKYFNTGYPLSPTLERFKAGVELADEYIEQLYRYFKVFGVLHSLRGDDKDDFCLGIVEFKEVKLDISADYVVEAAKQIEENKQNTKDNVVFLQDQVALLLGKLKEYEEKEAEHVKFEEQKTQLKTVTKPKWGRPSIASSQLIDMAKTVEELRAELSAKGKALEATIKNNEDLRIQAQEAKKSLTKYKESHPIDVATPAISFGSFSQERRTPMQTELDELTLQNKKLSEEIIDLKKPGAKTLFLETQILNLKGVIASLEQKQKADLKVEEQKKMIDQTIQCELESQSENLKPQQDLISKEKELQKKYLSMEETLRVTMIESETINKELARELQDLKFKAQNLNITNPEDESTQTYVESNDADTQTENEFRYVESNLGRFKYSINSQLSNYLQQVQESLKKNEEPERPNEDDEDELQLIGKTIGSICLRFQQNKAKKKIIDKMEKELEVLNSNLATMTEKKKKWKNRFRKIMKGGSEEYEVRRHNDSDEPPVIIEDFSLNTKISDEMLLVLREESRKDYIQLEEQIKQLKLEVLESSKKLPILLDDSHASGEFTKELAEQKIEFKKIIDSVNSIHNPKTIENIHNEINLFYSTIEVNKIGLDVVLTDIGRATKIAQKVILDLHKATEDLKRDHRQLIDDAEESTKIIKSAPQAAEHIISQMDAFSNLSSSLKTKPHMNDKKEKTILLEINNLHSIAEGVLKQKPERVRNKKYLQEILDFGGSEDWLDLTYFSMEKPMQHRPEFTTKQWELQKRINEKFYLKRVADTFLANIKQRKSEFLPIQQVVY